MATSRDEADELFVPNSSGFRVCTAKRTATLSVTALNPVFVFHSIFKISGPYLVACLVLGVVIGVDLAAESMIGFVTIPIIPGVLIGFVSLYFLIVEARILGLLYFVYRDRLQWF